MRRLLITLFAISGFLQLLNAQAGVGAKYGARDPAKCRSTKEPDKGAPTPEQVKRYVMCALEGEQGVAPPNLTLLENVQVEIGKGRPFSPSADRYKSDADVNSPVYPIRGSYDMYICSPPVAPFRVIGNNCSVFGHSQATGACYRTTFGDWSCSMAPIGGTSQRDNVAAPK